MVTKGSIKEFFKPTGEKVVIFILLGILSFVISHMTPIIASHVPPSRPFIVDVFLWEAFSWVVACSLVSIFKKLKKRLI